METATADEIMEATYQALCEHGYANLTMQRIADESTMTSAAIHYHFDTKEQLMTAFLQHMLERFEDQIASDASDPRERLATFLEAVFAPADAESDFPTALMDLKAQAPYQDGYRTRFQEADERMRSLVAEAVRDGIAAGHFDDADPEIVARFVVTAIDGAHAREVALGEARIESRRLIETYLESRIGWTPGVTA